MPKNKTQVKRKSISKKLRFEVFKRDGFIYQYCGRKAPDVVLHIDHITPVSKGGQNTLMNLGTSCIDCNLGKRIRELGDNSAVVRRQKQAEILAERLEQIEMLRDWHVELINQWNVEVAAVNEAYKKLTNNKYNISESYKNQTISELVKKYGLALVLEALSDSVKGFYTSLVEDWENASKRY